MKREILFRGFCPDENGTQIAAVNGKEYKGEWKEGYIAKCFKNWNMYIVVTVFERDEQGNLLGDRKEALAYKVISETVGEYIKTLPNGDKAFSNSRFEIISNVKGEDGGSGKRTDTATIRFNDKQAEWELKVFHNGKYKRIARAGYFLNSNETKVIGTIFDKEEV